MTRFKMFSLAVAVAVVCVASAQAATITLSTNYLGSYDNLGNPLPGSPPAPLNAASAPNGGPAAVFVPGAIHQFGVYVNITGLPAGQDFQTMQFDMDLGPGVTPNTTFGDSYQGESPQYDPPPNGGALASVFSQNGDAGIANDLNTITILANGANSHAGVHLRHPGENGEAVQPDTDNSNLVGPYQIGTVFVNWDGSFVGGKSWINAKLNTSLPNPFTAVDANNLPVLYTQSDMAFAPRTEWIQGEVIPEPASLSLIGLAVVGALGWIRRR